MKFLLYLTLLLCATILLSTGCESHKTSTGESETEQTTTANAPDSAEVEILPVTEVATAVKGEWIAESLVEKSVVQKLGLDSFFAVCEIDDSLFSRINGFSYNDDGPVKREDLRLLKLIYKDFDGNTRRGELICNISIGEDLVEIFKNLYAADYPLERVCLIENYNCDDVASMEANNTSCFNYRKTPGGGKLSKHAYGRAIDINPLYNPYQNLKNGKVLPSEGKKYTDRSQDFSFKIDKNDAAYKEFTKRGFKWGGNWRTIKDYQHFEK